MITMLFRLSLVILSAITVSTGQQVPNSWPQNYSGIPQGGYSPEWQSYFEVTDPLPNISFPVPRSFAGSISTNTPGHPNNSLFYWAFEKEHGSLTCEESNEPWAIWLNGGPGASSLVGTFIENGPFKLNADFSLGPNKYSWSNQVDIIYVDNPVGVGYSTAESNGGYVTDEDRMAEDFMGFLRNLVKVYPSLQKRPFYLMGESYAGAYCPYISKALLSSASPPVKLKKMVIGDAVLGEFAVYEEISTVTVLETYPEIIAFDKDVLEYFRTQLHICKYDLNLTYPQKGHFPTLVDPRQTVADQNSPLANLSVAQARSSFRNSVAQKFATGNGNAQLIARDMDEREDQRRRWKRDLAGRANGTLDSYYGCFLFEELLDYAVNFTYPWDKGGDFDVYYAPDALSPEVNPFPDTFMNDARVRRAVHAPTSMNYSSVQTYPFASSFTLAPGSNIFGDPSPAPMKFLSELATNASRHNVSFIFYSGNDDTLVAHRSTQTVIQNTTFGGYQGFTKVPSTAWYGDDGTLAGTVHQERNLTYVLFKGAGHEVPEYQPQNAATFLREFVLGSNQTGLLLPNSTTVGGEDPELAGDILPGTDVVFYGSGTTASSSIAPSASVAAWASFLATFTAAPKPTTIV